jgi:hypothetical protein
MFLSLFRDAAQLRKFFVDDALWKVRRLPWPILRPGPRIFPEKNIKIPYDRWPSNRQVSAVSTEGETELQNIHRCCHTNGSLFSFL